MEKDPRDIVIENLMKEVKFAMTRDIVTVTENLKAFREIRAGKQAKRKAKRQMCIRDRRKAKREAHNNRWRKNYDTPITW